MNEQNNILIDKFLPQNWIISKLSNISKIESGYGFPIKYQGKKEGDIPFFKVGDISKTVMKGSTYLTNADNYISYEECKELNAKVLKKGTIVFARIGEAIKLNRRAILGQDSLIDNNVAGVFSYLDNLYLYYYLLTVKFGNYSRATTVPSVRKTDIEEINIPVPPLNEQKRIVSKLEELFTKLDAGIKYIRKTQILLKQYRQSVLKNAFEGKLTAKWREENKNNIIESISNFVESIFIHQNFELEIEQIKKDSEIYGIYDFPKEWTWVRIKNIVKKIQYGTSEKAIGDSNGIPVLRMGNIYDGKIIYDNLKYYSSNWSHLNEFLLEDGDVLFNRTNSAELVGKTAIYQSSYPKSVFASYLIRIKILKNYYIPMILSYFINSIYGRKFIKSVVSQQVGQANVNGTKLSLMPIPLMSLLEQSQIIKEIEKRISKIENTSKILDSNIKYGMRLKSNILSNAFEGKLVSQDPSDEPAGVLLERIIQERKSNELIKKEKSKITSKFLNNSKQMRLM